jgi:DNA-binding transcriptional LysR family regulator
MNIHHLELFYYVARHGGITEAVRNMPYGIQQPAMSGQIIQLEEFLGTTLFHRRPFQLTTQGQELYEFIRPFFENLDAMAARLRGGEAQHVRIGASEIVLRDHLPSILRTLGQRFKRLKVTLREGYQPQLESWITRNELDLAITLLGDKLPPGTSGLRLFELPLVLLVPHNSPIKSAQELWARDRIEESLISLPTNEPIYKNFQEGLARLGVDWFTSIEVSTVELVQTYVANGHGIGLSIVVPLAKQDPALRTLPLENFKPVTFGVIYHSKPAPIVETFLAAIREAAAQLTGAKAENSQSKSRKDRNSKLTGRA